MKDEIREKLKIKRRYFTEYRRKAADDLIAENFFSAYGGYESFFIYNSFGTEADTRGIIAELVRRGKRVYLPRVEGKNMLPVPFGKTRKGAFGAEEPIGEAYTGEIDIAVAPLLAVNGAGFRIGYGGGYYDRYFKENPSPLRVGLGYFFQMEEFAADVWDIKLNQFICERGIYYFDD